MLDDQRKAYEDFYYSARQNKILEPKHDFNDPPCYGYGSKLLSLNGIVPWRGQGRGDY
jgi:hypothetical protein